MADEPAYKQALTTNIETAESLEALALKLGDVYEQVLPTQRIISVSHAVDHEDPERKPYSVLVVSQDRRPTPIDD
jgi:hypothetical protein